MRPRGRKPRNAAQPSWRYQQEFSEACRGLVAEAEASLNQLATPQRHQQSVHPSNLLERAFVEERRRTKVILHLFKAGSLVNLVFGG